MNKIGAYNDHLFFYQFFSHFFMIWDAFEADDYSIMYVSDIFSLIFDTVLVSFRVFI